MTGGFTAPPPRGAAAAVESSGRLRSFDATWAAGEGPETAFEGASLVTIPVLVAVVRARWRLCGATTALGLLAAGIFGVSVPPQHGASTSLVLSHPSQVDPAKAMLTDAQVLESRAVAQGAIDRLGVKITPAQLQSQYSVVVRSNDIMRVRAVGPTDGAAIARADALATSFLAVRRAQLQAQEQVSLRAFQDRISGLTADLSSVDGRIARLSQQVGGATPSAENPPGSGGTPGSGAAAGSGATSGSGATAGSGASTGPGTVAGLTAQRSALNDELNSLRGRVNETMVQAEVLAGQSHVLDPASAERRSVAKTWATDAAAGMVGGFALGAGGVVLQTLASNRTRRREDVMEAIGAPVAVSCGSLRGGRRAQRRRFARQLRRPEGPLSTIVGHLRQVLSDSRSPGLVLVSVDSDWVAALAAGLLAADLAGEGYGVSVVDLTGGLAVSAITGDAAVSAINGEAAGDHGATTGTVVVVANLDPAVGAAHLGDWSVVAVAIVTAGRSSATALRSVGIMLRDAGVALHSVVLVGADESDESVGLGHLDPRAGPALWVTR